MPLVKPGVIIESVVVKGNIEDVYDFMADFSNAVKWDPGVLKSECIKDKTFALTTIFNGKKSEMTYNIVSYKRPYLVTLKGDGPNVRAIDTIKFSKIDNNYTKIEYEADLTLKGFRRPFIVFIGKSLKKLGEDAIEGIRKYFFYGSKHGIK